MAEEQARKRQRYATPEEAHAAALQRKREYSAKKRRERGAPTRRTFATEEERKTAIAERRRRWRQEHPEAVAESVRRRKEKVERMKAEDPDAYVKMREARNEQAARRMAELRAELAAQKTAEARERARAAFDARTAELQAARAAMPENGDWLRAWCEARGLNAAQARKRAGIGPETWGILWGGGKTIPSLALIVGHNLGMTPEEVAHLGIIPDRHRWELYGDDQRAEQYMPEHFDLHWPERVGSFNAARALRKLQGGCQPAEPEAPRGRPAKNRPAGPTPTIMHKRICAICEKPFLTSRASQFLCSRECSAAFNRQRRLADLAAKKAEAAHG